MEEGEHLTFFLKELTGEVACGLWASCRRGLHAASSGRACQLSKHFRWDITIEHYQHFSIVDAVIHMQGCKDPRLAKPAW